MAARSQTGPPGSGCEAHWILVLSTGRSGSTTILQMLNAVPFIELAVAVATIPYKWSGNGRLVFHGGMEDLSRFHSSIVRGGAWAGG